MAILDSTVVQGNLAVLGEVTTRMAPAGDTDIDLGQNDKRWRYLYCYGISDGTNGFPVATMINRFKEVQGKNYLINKSAKAFNAPSIFPLKTDFARTFPN